MSANPALLGSVSTGMGVEPEHLQAVSRGLGTATVPALLAEATATISENSGLDAAVVKSIKSRSIATTASCLLRADDLYAVVQESLRSLPTGFEALDVLLNGGVYTAEMVEFEGEVAAGKTQVCMSAAVMSAKQGIQVLYIDTSGSFSPKRLLTMAGLDPDGEHSDADLEFLSRITMEEVFDLHQLVGLLDKTFLAMSAGQYHKQYGIIVVDSLAAVAMPALSSQHGQGHALLSYVGRTLLRLADEFCLAVITTNFTSKSRIEAECKPSLGISWAGIPSTRVWLRRDHAATASATGGSAGAEASLQITATVVKSNRLETGACTSLRL